MTNMAVIASGPASGTTNRRVARQRRRARGPTRTRFRRSSSGDASSAGGREVDGDAAPGEREAGVLDGGAYAVLSLLRGGVGSPTIENAGMPRDVDLDIDSSSVVEHLLTEQRVSGTAGSCAR